MSLKMAIATIDSHKTAILSVVPPTLRDQFQWEAIRQSVALSIRASAKLAKCSPESIYASAMYITRLGLNIGGHQQQAWLIPYAGQCKPQIGAQGRIELAYRSGKIRRIIAEVVRENDEFRFNMADGSCHHTWDLRKSDRGPIIGSYARAWTTFSEDPILEILTEADFDVIQSEVKRKNRGLPDTYRLWGGEMRKRSVVNRILKRCPKSVDIMEALTNDARIEVGEARVSVTDGRVEVIDAEPVEIPNVDLTYDDPPENERPEPKVDEPKTDPQNENPAPKKGQMP